MKKRLVSALLAVLMVFTVFAQPLGATTYALAAEESVAEEVVTTPDVLIKKGTDEAAVNEILNQTFGRKEGTEWEYYCEGKEKLLKISTNNAWGSVAGFESSTTEKVIFVTVTTNYTHQSLAANSDGEYKVRVQGTTEEYTINKVSKLASSLVLKDGVSFTYNMDVEVMKQNVFDNVIDWEASVLPAGATIGDFAFEYKAVLEAAEQFEDFSKLLNTTVGMKYDINLDDYLKAYVPFEGKHLELFNYNLGGYPQIGAGTQEIKVTYNGNDDYKASNAAEATVEVNKANVKVKVKSTTAFVSDAKNGLNLVTTDPADKFNITTIYAGITSNVTVNLYIELPKKYTDNALIKIIDPILSAAGQPTLTEMLQNGMSLGELRELVKAEEVVGALELIGVDTGVFGQIIKVVDKLPSITDNIRIAFGTPNTAGAYTVTAIASNKNYNTGVGVGALLVRADKATLAWNGTIANKKISVADAKTFDFGASIQVNGENVKDQSSVKVLYTGLTSKFKPYASSTAPTEAGSYVETVTVLGGNYLATPITRTFTIKK